MFSEEETEQEIILQLNSFYSSNPLDPIVNLDRFSGISREAYEAIIKEINIFGKSLEKFRTLYYKFDEEGFRDYFLPHLNSILRNQSATGETFNKSGKTDILIQDNEGNNIFIAECKIWHGEKALLVAIDQLLNLYVTWRDEFTALIIFNKDNSKFTDLVLAAKKGIVKHPLFYKFNKETETTASYMFRHPEDERRNIYLELIIFNCV